MDKPLLNVLLSLLGTATLVVDIILALFAIILILYFSMDRPFSGVRRIVEAVADNYLAIGFVAATSSMMGSLFLSEIAGFIPCELCWLQRICMYPQSLIFGIALFVNDNFIKKYCLPLSVIGMLIAIYHIFVQSFPLLFKCSDRTANCALVQFKYYGYITIPVMSLTGFLVLILIMVARKRVIASKRKK